MSTSFRYTSADLEDLPDVEGLRYEIIDGKLHVSRATHWCHQFASGQVFFALQTWNLRTGTGIAISTPGVIFAPDDDVIPDLIWLSKARLAALADDRGHFRGAPELVVEVLSAGAANVYRDREAKLKLYSRQGVQEYWIVDWRARTVDVFRREGDALRLVATLTDPDVLTSPLLPGFSCPVASLWATAE